MISNKHTFVALLLSICSIIPLNCMDKKRSNDMIESSAESHDPKKQKMQTEQVQATQFSEQAKKRFKYISQFGIEPFLLHRIGHDEQDIRSPLPIYVINEIIAHVKPQLTNTIQSFLLSCFKVPHSILFEGNNKLNSDIVFDPNERSFLFNTINTTTNQLDSRLFNISKNGLASKRTVLEKKGVQKQLPLRFQKFDQSQQAYVYIANRNSQRLKEYNYNRAPFEFTDDRGIIDNRGSFIIRHEKRISCFTRVNKWLASGSSDKTIKLWNKHTGKCIGTLKGHNNAITTVHFSPDEKYLLSLSKFDKAIKIWELETQQCLSTLGYEETPSSQIPRSNFLTHDAAFSPDGKNIISFSPTQGLIWNIESLYTLKQRLRNNTLPLPLTKLLVKFAKVGLSRKRKNKPELTESQKNKLEQMGFNTSPQDI